MLKNIVIFILSGLFFAGIMFGCGSSSDSSGGESSPAPPANATITGTVSGTVVVAIDKNDNEVDRNTATGNPKTFTLSLPPRGDYRFYFIENEGTSSERVFPLYQGATNLFTISSAAAVDLGFVDTSTGVAVPANNPLDVSGVSSGGKNIAAPPEISLLNTWNITNEGTFDVGEERLTFYLNGKFAIGSNEGSISGTYTVNTGVTPHHIDMVYNEDVMWEGENLGRYFYGLFEINGDKLKTNWEPNDRPEDFESYGYNIWKKSL